MNEITVIYPPKYCSAQTLVKKKVIGPPMTLAYQSVVLKACRPKHSYYRSVSRYLIYYLEFLLPPGCQGFAPPDVF